MGATDSNGIWKYDSSDIINTWPAYGNLLANSVSNVFTDIRQKAIYTASSQSDANTKVTALKTGGLTPSTAAPFFFWRSDTKSLWMHDGTTWYEAFDQRMKEQDVTSLVPAVVSNGINMKPRYIIKQGSLVTGCFYFQITAENLPAWTDKFITTFPAELSLPSGVSAHVALPFTNGIAVKLSESTFSLASSSPVTIGGGYNATLTWKVAS